VLYRRFVAEGATGDARAAALQNEARCREIVGRTPAAEPDVAAPVPAPSVPADTPAPAPAPPRARVDRVGIGLLAGGGAALLVGAVLVGVGESLRATQTTTRDYDRFDRLDTRIDALHISGGVTLGIGAVLAIVGAVRLGLARKRRVDGAAARLGLRLSPSR
jgi:hypothetical protein